RCSGLITPIATATEVTPGTAPATAVTSRSIVLFSGHPAVVRSMCTVTAPPSATSTSRTIPSSVMGRRISGSITWSSAERTSSGESMRPILGAAGVRTSGPRTLAGPFHGDVVVLVRRPHLLEDLLEQVTDLGPHEVACRGPPARGARGCQPAGQRRG